MLEGALHDGVQQDLIAVAVRLPRRGNLDGSSAPHPRPRYFGCAQPAAAPVRRPRRPSASPGRTRARGRDLRRVDRARRPAALPWARTRRRSGASLPNTARPSRRVLWDNFWYAGNFPLASYSLLYYLPAALIGNLPLVIGASVVSTLLFASIAFQRVGLGCTVADQNLRDPRRGARVHWPLCVCPRVQRTARDGQGACRSVDRASPHLSPPSLWASARSRSLFLCLIMLAVALGKTRPLSRRSTGIAAAFALLAGGELRAAGHLSQSRDLPVPCDRPRGRSRLSASSARSLHVMRAVVPRSVAFFALWADRKSIAFSVATPIGGNWTRLGDIGFPLMLLTAALAGFRPRKLVLAALAVAFAYNVIPFALLIPYRLDSRPTTAGFWQPALRFLRGHSGPNFRIEVVPTAAHWESYWLPRAGFPLARGCTGSSTSSTTRSSTPAGSRRANYRRVASRAGGRLRAPSGDQASIRRGASRGEATSTGRGRV